MNALLARRRALAGFTLIELLIVLVIIGILVAIGVPAYLKYTGSANDRDAQAALRTAYKAALAGDAEVNTGRFPVATSVVSDVKADEPAASITRGDCVGAVAVAPVKQVLVDPSSTSSSLTMCVRSASGTIWRLAGPLTGNPTMTDGSSVSLTMSGYELTDTQRAASASWTLTQSGTQSDGTTPLGGTFVGRAATNLFRNGQNDGGVGVYWFTFGPTGSTLGSPDTTTAALFSSQSIKVTTNAAGAGQGASAKTATGLAAAAGTVAAGSIYVKGVAGQSYNVRLRWENTDASLTDGTNTTFTATGSWQLITPASLSVATGETGDRLDIVAIVNGTRAETFWIAHPMLETGHAVVAPYVATSGGSTATKPASRIQAPASLLTATQGWVAMRVKMGWAQTQAALVAPGLNIPLFFWTDAPSGTGTKYLWGYVNYTNGNFGTQSFNGANDGSAAVGTPAYVAGDYLTLVFAWDSSYLYTSVNGSSLTASKAARAHGVQTGMNSTFEIGDIGLSRWLDSSILWLATGTGTLTDADAATINSWGSTDPSRSSFPAAAQPTAVWDGVSPAMSLR